MLMKRFIFSVFVAALGLTSCGSDDSPAPPPPPDGTDQTVFMYLPWSDNLTDFFEKNIANFESVVAQGTLHNERILVFFAESPAKATLFELVQNGDACERKMLKSYDNPAFTTAQGIASILKDVKAFAPAKRYGMTIGCHGMGWLPIPGSARGEVGQRYHWEYEGEVMTRFFGGTKPEHRVEVSTLVEGITQAEMKMEYILFDDCYMSSIEVAYDLRNVTDHLISCPTEIMADGMPYANIGKHLIGTVDYAAVCDEFHKFYSDYRVPSGTIGVTDCRELDALVPIMKEINARFTFDQSKIKSVQSMDGYTPVIFFDYGDYVAKLCGDAELLERFSAQLDRAVPPQCRKHTGTYPTSMGGFRTLPIKAYSGITTSDPSVNPMAVTAKTATAWYKATH